MKQWLSSLLLIVIPSISLPQTAFGQAKELNYNFPKGNGTSLSDSKRSLTCTRSTSSDGPPKQDCINAILDMPQFWQPFTVVSRAPLIWERTEGACHARATLWGGSDEETTWGFLYTTAMMAVTGCVRNNGNVDRAIAFTGPHGKIIVQVERVGLREENENGNATAVLSDPKIDVG